MRTTWHRRRSGHRRRDPELQGRVLAALAEEYGVVEPDGGRPVSPRLMFGGGPVFPALPPEG